MDSSLFTPHLSPAGLASVRPPCLDSAVPLEQILRVFRGGVWRARLQPFQVQEWCWDSREGTQAREQPPIVSGSPADFESLIYPPDLPAFHQAVREYLEGDRSERPHDLRMIVDGGELLWTRHWLLPADDHQVLGLMRVVSEEKRLQWEIMRTSEQERCRVGQEIHDDLCQILTGVNYLVHLVQQRLQATQPAEAEELSRINQEIQIGLERTRALAHGLLPAKSDFNSLSQALRDLARQIATRFHIELVVNLPPDPPALSRERLLHLYRIVQEAASNSFKHARATRIEVTLSERDGRHVLSIEDDGPGLPADGHRAEGVGLNVMRNRAELLGGWLEVGNGSRGALVQVHLPQC